MNRMLHVCAAAAAAAALLALSAPAAATVVANFTDGNGTALPDQYAGAAGNGWAGAWGTNPSNGSFSSAGVVDGTGPLPALAGGGNFLSATFVATSSSAEKRGFIRRDFNAFGDVHPAQPHRVSVDFRLDGASTFTHADDYVVLYDHPVANLDTGPASTWMIRAHGAVNGTAGAREWAFYNGDTADTAFSTSRWVDTNVPLVSGNVYRFVIDTDPATKTWRGSVTDLTAGTPAYTSGVLNWRSYQSNPTTGGSVFHVGGRVSAANETMAFSLDSLSVVPEPAAAGLAAAAGLLALAGGRRRRRPPARTEPHA